jgi:hypothetical protein
MTSARIPKPYRNLVKKAEAAGWQVKPTSKGFMLLSPNGKDQIAVHGSESDHRSVRNTEARLRRAGLDI